MLKGIGDETKIQREKALQLKGTLLICRMKTLPGETDGDTISIGK